MAAPADVIAEMKTLGIGSKASEEQSEDIESNGANGAVEPFPYREEVVKHRQTITEISRMADKMSTLVQEIRNTTRETDDRLRQMEADLKILGLE